MPLDWIFDDVSYFYWALPSAVVITIFKRNLTPLCVLSALQSKANFRVYQNIS